VALRRKRKKPDGPNRVFEIELQNLGHTLVAGLDEVGRGCLAGPVVACAVILPESGYPEGIDDSKKLSAEKREVLSEKIRACAIAWAIGTGTVEEIDTINILQASRLAMKRALESLRPQPAAILVDGRERIETPLFQKAIISGDRLSVSIAAASIVAKVYRDRLMGDLDLMYPGYGFAGHKGYGCPSHRHAMQALGLTPLHRKSFSWTPV
jgi:ribonuclease HII